MHRILLVSYLVRSFLNCFCRRSPTVDRERLQRRLLLPLLFVVLAAAAPARAEEVPPGLRRDLGAFALYGRSLVKWSGAASMPVRGAVGSEVEIDFAARTDASGDESFVAAPVVHAEDATRLHFAYANRFVADADVVVDHPVEGFQAPILSASRFPSPPAIECGGSDVTVDATNSPLALAPGRYRDVLVTADRALRLAAGGRYEFCSLRVRAGAAVDSGTGTRVLVRDYLAAGARARLSGEGACGTLWIVGSGAAAFSPTGAAIDFDHGGPSARARIEGQFFTPGRIVMAQHNDYVGRFWADRIDGRTADQVTRTLADCHAPRCGDGTLDAGEACDDGNNLDGDCCSAFCEVLAEGTACDDGSFCTATDRCDATGRCVGSGDPCEAPDGDANCSESCDDEADACVAPDPEGSACDDGLWCNGADRCAGGRCVVHEDSPCPGPDDDANCSESCNEQARSCNARDAVGAPCDDGRFCTVGETCDASGSCDGGASPCAGVDGDGDCAESCDELADSCTAADPDGSACDDGLFCTAADRCDGRGQCRGLGDPCPQVHADHGCRGSCDEPSRSCTAPDRDGTPCDDGIPCTTGERCLAGSCAAVGATSCDDFDPCTDEFCSDDGSCVRSYNSAPCDDGNPCTTGDRCILGECGSTGTVDCRDDDLCTADVCDPADGTCRHAHVPAATCYEVGRSQTKIDLGFSAKDGVPVERLMTSWRSETGADPDWRVEIGDPSRGDRFAVCFYDESRSLPALAYRLDFDEASLEGARWKRKWRGEDLIFRLKPENGTSQGVSSVRIGGGKHGSPSFRLRAGAGGGCSQDCRTKFDPPAARADGRMFAMEPAMTVQWVAESGACWSARYQQATNTASGFHARARR